MNTDATNKALAERHAATFTARELQSRLAAELSAFERQAAHNRRVTAGPVGRATLDALRTEVAITRAALAIKNS